MKLSELFVQEEQVERRTRSNGGSYYQRGAVQRIETEDGAIRAVVVGTIPYEVRLEPRGNRLAVACSCPYFSDRLETCKHIWAACLAAEQRGYLKGAGDFMSADFSQTMPEDFPGKAYAKPRVVQKPTPGWRKQLQPLLAKLGADESRLRFRTAAEREFAYIINVGATLVQEQLTVEVAQRDKKINGEWGKLKAKKLAYPSESAAQPLTGFTRVRVSPKSEERSAYSVAAWRLSQMCIRNARNAAVPRPPVKLSRSEAE